MPIDIKEEFRKEDELRKVKPHERHAIQLCSGYGGKSLKDFLATPAISREAYISDILYKDSILMLCADAGLGKSVLSTQMALSLANGSKCFDYFEVPKPLNVFYILTERTMLEPKERLELMIGEDKKLNYDNLYITTGLQPLDFSNLKHHQRVIDYMLDECMEHGITGIDVCIIDPLYQAVKRGLTNEEAVSAFCGLSNRIQQTFGCSNILVHHTNRGGRDSEGKRTGKDMYGSSFLFNHVSGVYRIKKGSEGGTVWEKEKDNHGNLIESFTLDFNEDTYLSYVNQSKTKKSRHRQVVDCIKTYLQTNEPFTYKDIAKALKMSKPNVIREVKMISMISDGIVLEDTGNKRDSSHLWRVLKQS